MEGSYVGSLTDAKELIDLAGKKKFFLYNVYHSYIVCKNKQVYCLDITSDTERCMCFKYH